MAEDIHSQITISNELHVPKGFTEASINQVPSKNAVGVLEWVDTDGFTGPQGPAGPSGSLATLSVASIDDPSSEMITIGLAMGEFVIAHQIIPTLNDKNTTYLYDTSNSEALNSPYVLETLEGGNTRWLAVGGSYTVLETVTSNNSTFISASDKASFSDSLSTGFEGAPPLLSINGDNTKFNMSECTVVHVDNSTIPATVVKTFTPASVDNVPIFLLTETSTFISIDINGDIVQRVSKLTPEQRRDEATVGFLSHPDMTIIDSYINNPQTTRNSVSQAHDLMEAIGFFSTSGNQITGIAATLSMQKATGSGFALNANAAVTEKDPHNFNMPVLNPAVMFQILRDATPVAISEFIDPSQWDDNGVLSVVPANNNATINYVYIFPNNQIAYVLGQQIFTTFSDAKDAAGTESVVLPSDISDSALLLARVIVRKTTTDLTNSSEAFILPSSSVSGGGSSLTSLQQAYEISVEPEIEINSAHGAFTVQDAAIPLGVNILEVNSAGGASTLLSVDVNGLELSTGARVNDISIDGTLAADSDTAIPTQKAVKTYVDNLPAGTSTFTALTDTPANYTAQSLNAVRVNVGETGLEFYTPAGASGDVVGPATSVDTSIAIYNGTDNKTIKDSKVLIDVDGRISQTGLGNSTYFGNGAGIVDDLSNNTNTGVGSGALGGIITGSRSSAFGFNSIRRATGSSNSAYGAYSGHELSGGARNNMFGDASGFNLSSGSDNGLYGYANGNTITTGSRNLLFGNSIQVPTPTTDDYLSIGDAIIVNDMTTGDLEIKGRISQTGLGTSTYLGFESGLSDSLANRNNTAVGSKANSVSSGTNNTSVGNLAGFKLSVGNSNSFFGASTASSGPAALIGSQNTGIGYHSSQDISGGAGQNTTLGAESGKAMNVSSRNLLLGYNSGSTLVTGDDNILLGSVQTPTTTTSDYLSLGDVITSTANGTNTVEITATGMQVKTQIFPEVDTLATTGTITTDCSAGNTFTTTLTGTATLGNPTNLKLGATYTWFIDIDGVGGHALTWGSIFHFAGAARPSITNFATAKNMLVAVYDGTNLRCTLSANVA